jgi:O-antigen/teichoic acid export membrane protein
MVTDATRDTVIHRRVVRNTISNYLGKLITLCTWFFLTPLILHQLGPTAYGLWALVGSMVSYGSLLDFGVGRAVIKYVAEYNARGETEQAHSLVATALCLYSVLSLIVILLSAIIAPLFPDLFNVPPDERATATWLMLLMGSGIAISIPCTTATAVLRGLQRYDILNLITIIGTLLTAAATITILFLGGDVLAMVAISIAVMLVMQAPSIWFINRIAPELRFGWRGAKRSLARTVISFSSPLFVIDLATRLQTKTDEIVISAFLMVSAVTPYAIARRLSEVAQILTDQFMKVLLPLAAELHAENDWVRLRFLYIAGTRLTLAIFLPISCTVVILARPILTAWVGPEYGNYPHLVTILTFASLINTSQWPASSVLQSMARHQLLAVTSLGSGLANLALSIALLHPFGLTGVALGTLIPTAAECLGFVLPYAMRVIGVSAAEALKEIFIPALLPAIPVAILLYALQQVVEPSSLLSIMVVAASGVLVYMLGYLSVGASQVERQIYRRLALSTIRFAEMHLKRL